MLQVFVAVGIIFSKIVKENYRIDDSILVFAADYRSWRGIFFFVFDGTQMCSCLLWSRREMLLSKCSPVDEFDANSVGHVVVVGAAILEKSVEVSQYPSCGNDAYNAYKCHLSTNLVMWG